MKYKTVKLTLEEPVLRMIDEAAETLAISRDRFIQDAVYLYLIKNLQARINDLEEELSLLRFGPTL